MSRKRIPSTSKLNRTGPVAYARKQKSGDGDKPDDDEDAADAKDKVEDKADGAEGKATEEKDKDEAAAKETKETKETKDEAEPAKKKGQPKGFVAPENAITVVSPSEVARAAESPDVNLRSRTATLTMPAAPPEGHGEPPAMPGAAKHGEPPAMPTSVAPAASPSPATVENPTFMPGPRDVPGGRPDDPAPPPGFVPRGDSRSLRRWGDKPEFALVYRVQTFVICRFGAVGTRGQWRVVEYPTSASASHAYAKECSHFVTEGFSDYRE
jgi:hypothetical protein